MSEHPGHPNAAALLALVDGELNVVTRWRTRRHIARCWPCRSKLLELQSTVAEVGSVAYTSPPDVDRIAVARARWDFRKRAADFEAERSEDFRHRLTFGAGLAAVLLVSVAGTLAILTISRAPSRVVQRSAPSAAELLARAETQETAIRSEVREERFTVEIQSSRSARTASRELRVLSAPRAGLHSARWLDSQGGLRNAVFADQSQQDAVFSRAEGLRPVHLIRASHRQPLFSGLAATDAEIDGMEAAVVAWIERQVWEPVSLAREAVALASESGATLRISREGDEFVWVAEANVKGATVRLTLRGVEQRPLSLMHIAWDSASGSGSVRIRREKRQDYFDLHSAPVWLRAESLRQPSAPLVEPVAELAVRGPSVSELLGAEVEVLAALHRGGLCQKDAIRVSSGLNTVHVVGTFASEQDRERVQSIIASIPQVALLAVELRVIESHAEPAVIGRSAADRGQVSRAAVAEPWLRAKMGVGTRSSEREMFNRMNSLVSLSEDMLSDTWALENLAEYFPPERQQLLDARDRDLLLSMVRDHAKSATARLFQIESQLAFAAHPSPLRTAVPALVWQEHAPVLRKAAQQLCDGMLRFFASSDASLDPVETNPENSDVPGLLLQLGQWSPALAESAASHTVSR